MNRKIIALLLLPFCVHAASDILISDFEFEKWSGSGWNTSGDAFGEGPVTGAIKRQQAVSGFKGIRLVNSFHDGSDRPTGTLRSPSFKIERPFINFLIGAGGWEGKTCMNLIVDGKIVRTATGDRTQRRGNENLSWKTWDVSDLSGKTANIEIIDNESGSWGHINVDHIIQSDKPENKNPIKSLPAGFGSMSETSSLLTRLRNFEKISATSPSSPAYTQLLAEIEKQNGKENLTLADQQRGARELRERLWNDPYRPRYHMLPPDSFWNDINGCIYWKGRYHVFFLGRQAPDAKTILEGKDTMRAREVWLHASSADLVHWIWHPTALMPKFDGTMLRGIFSGGAVAGADKPTLIYHVPGQGTCISTADDDELIHWTPFPQNPVISARTEPDAEYQVFDPAAWKEGDIYYALIGNKNKRPGYEGDTSSLFKSTDLVNWTYLHPLYKSDRKWTHVDEDAACPDFFPIGKGKHMLVTHIHTPMYGAQYYIGTFKDEVFHPEQHGYMNFPGGQLSGPETLLDGEGRRVFWGWVREAPGAGRNGWGSMATLPRILELDDKGKLKITPAPELEILRTNPRQINDISIPSEKELVLPTVMNGNVQEITIAFEPGTAEVYGVKVCRSADGSEQTVIEYSAKDKTLSIDVSKASLNEGIRYEAYDRGYARRKDIPEEKRWTTKQTAPLTLKKGEPLQLRIFIDRSIVEVFANDRQVITQRIYPTRKDSLGISLFSQKGDIKVRRIEAWTLSPTNSW